MTPFSFGFSLAQLNLLLGGQVTVLGSEGGLGGFRVVCGVGLPVEELGEDGVLH